MNRTPRQAQRSKRPRQAQRSKRSEQLEQLWNNLLSGQPELIRAAYVSLDTHNQKAVFAHLQRMISETGWLPEQRASAKAAIQALGTQSNQEK